MTNSQGEQSPAGEEPDKPVRRYDKGERRFKHVGREAYAEIEFVHGRPDMAVGKCPNTLSVDDCEAMLEDAVAGPNGDRDIDYPKKLYTVHDGVIYEAQTTTAGQSYHGYPYRGRLSRKLLKELASIARKKKCETEFNAWVKRHIQ
ncbi:MAG TPA: hypothetical protein VF650_13395 [Allosphingosinicella sp.]|jgi:hypothetical protein